VDIDPDMVKYAQTLAHLRFLENLTFEVMDIKQPLGFADNTFNIVNGRLLFAFMDRVTWPKLLAECYRVVKPGGAICLAEYEVTITNSISLQYFYSRLYKRLADQNRTFSVDRRSIGICHMLAHLLRQANFTNVASKPFLIDASSGSPMHYAGTKDTETSLLLLKPYLSQEIQDIEQEALFAQAQLDMRQEGFTSISYGLQVWGEKPI
jgi:SAM-dependent methyltransferase